MAQQTSIAWCDATLNFWQGCRKVSAGCKNCYMFRQKEGYGQDPLNIVRSKDPTFLMSKKLKAGDRVFVNSWSDFFIEEADLWRDDAWKEMKNHPHLTYIILTKRPERIAQSLPGDWFGGENYRHIWFLVSVEDQETAEERINALINEGDIAENMLGVSVEPLLDDIDLTVTTQNFVGPSTLLDHLSWVIIGGESGDVGTSYEPRPFPIESAVEMVKACANHKVACFVKQLGTVYAKAHGFRDDKGGDFELFPKELQVREFPGGGR